MNLARVARPRYTARNATYGNPREIHLFSFVFQGFSISKPGVLRAL